MNLKAREHVKEEREAILAAAREKEKRSAEEARTELGYSSSATGAGDSISGGAASPAAERLERSAVAARPLGGGEVGERSGRRVSSQSLRNLLRRSLRPRQARIPDWIRQVGEEVGLTKTETDSLAVTLGRALTRLVRFRISSRTDVIVVDMAAAAHTERARARVFLKSLLVRIGEETERASPPSAQGSSPTRSWACLRPSFCCSPSRGRASSSSRS